MREGVSGEWVIAVVAGFSKEREVERYVEIGEGISGPRASGGEAPLVAVV